ncbi:MAG: hypothetical protein E7420_04500 [Ruminococcaceae bacterium]|nr:hypothetical protein [Oscillospiraceae bacterium]
MKKLTALILIMLCMLNIAACADKTNDTVDVPWTENDVSSSDAGLSNEIPGYTLHVVDIVDTTKEGECDCAGDLEMFYEDELNEYYFDCTKSKYVWVMDNTGGTRDVVSALNEGLISIDSLDYYGIEYFAAPKFAAQEPEAYMFEVQMGDVINDEDAVWINGELSPSPFMIID